MPADPSGPRKRLLAKSLVFLDRPPSNQLESLDGGPIRLRLVIRLLLALECRPQRFLGLVSMIARRKPFPRRFAIEWLEERALLTIFDLAAIAGRVFRDIGNNGFNPGEEVSGVNVELYRDDGDGALDSGDTLVDSTTTDADGEYRFDRLTRATYFVKQLAQTGEAFSLPEVVSSPIVITLTDVQGVRGTTIDTFNQTAHAASAFGSTTSGISVANAPEAIGGTRKLEVSLSGTDGGLALSANVPTNSPQVLDFHETGTGGVHRVTWDGTSTQMPPQAQATFNARGLGGVDLTDEGSSTGLTLLLAGDVAGGQIQIVLNSSFSNASVATVPISHTGPKNQSQLYPLHEVYVDFSAFTSSGAGADFTDIGAIRITWLNDQSRTNGQIDSFEAIGPTVLTHDFSNPVDDGGQNDFVDLELTMQASEPTPSGEVVFTITVENVGSAAATNVRVADTLPSGLTFVTASSSDYDEGTGVWNVGSLGAEQTATLSITTQVNATGQFTNTAEISAIDQSDIDSIPGNNDPSEDDQASATIVIQNTAMSLVTKVNGDDANSPTGPYVPIGGQATFSYELTNTGSELLELTSLVDDNGTPNNLSDDFDVLELGEFLGNDTGTLGALDPGETWTYALAKVLSEAGQYAGASAAAARVIGATSQPPSVSTASDPAHAFVFSGGVRLEMRVNGQDANSPGSALVPVGSQPAFTYLVRNVGNVPLRDLVVIDDNGTPSDPLDDIDVLELADFVDSDSGLQGALDPGETWTFRLVKSSFAAGEFAASASVSGLPTDTQGISLSNSEPVSDDDPVHFSVQEVQQQLAPPIEIAVGIEETIPEPAIEELPQFDEPAVPVFSPSPLLLAVALPETTTTRTPFQIAYGNSQKLPDPVPIASSRIADTALRLRFHEIPEEQLQQVLLTLAEAVIADAEVADLADVQLARAPVNLPELPRDYLESPEEPNLAAASPWRWYLAAAAGLAFAGSTMVLIRPKLVQKWFDQRPRQLGRELRQVGARARRKITSVFAHSWW